MAHTELLRAESEDADRAYSALNAPMHVHDRLHAWRGGKAERIEAAVAPINAMAHTELLRAERDESVDALPVPLAQEP